MDWTTIISIVGIIGTWITIALVYYTLREMRNQRIASQKPDLIIPRSPNVSVYSYRKEGESNLLVPKWWSAAEPVKFGKYGWLESIPVKLYNVGFGAAKNIKLNWVVEYDKTLQQIKDYCYQHSIPIVLQLQGDSSITIHEQGTITAGFQLSSQINEYEFLMPVSITKEGLTSFAPQSLKDMLSIILYLRNHWMIQDEDNPELMVDFPPIKLELDYDDVEEFHYSKRFDITVSYGDSTPEEGKPVPGLEIFSVLFFEFRLRK